MASELLVDLQANFVLLGPAGIEVPHTIVLGTRDNASLQTRFVVRCTECRDEVVVVTRDDMAIADDKAGLAIRARLKEAAELHRRLVHQPMTYDAARALVARAVRENFPDRADEILRAIEKGNAAAEKAGYELARKTEWKGRP